MPAWRKILKYSYIIGIPFVCFAICYAIHKEAEVSLSKDKLCITPNNQKIKELQLLKMQVETNYKYSFDVVESELHRMGMINTKRSVDNESIRNLNQHIQKCLSAIGSYNGPCDGEQVSTYNAVIEFQSKNKLKVDGIIGRNTWKAIKAPFEKEKVN